MRADEYNSYLKAISDAENVSDRDKRKELLAGIRIRLLADYGLKDDDAKHLIKKCG